MNQYTTLKSRVTPLPANNIDTDQIIPARYLKITDKAGLGEALFADWRYQADGTPRPEFVLNKPESEGTHILLAGDNFGCGSSREHAPWALVGYGFRAVISTSFADIFRNNALKNGLLPVILDPAAHHRLIAEVGEDPSVELVIDLAEQTVRLPSGESFSFPMDRFSKTCLLQGIDELGYLLSFAGKIEEYETGQTDLTPRPPSRIGKGEQGGMSRD
jgi:3-isopropylmalate/(R)-2-methylmalate dehydratase small subunit